jgi:hypothetical protein
MLPTVISAGRAAELGVRRLLPALDIAMISRPERPGWWTNRRRRWAVVGSAVLLCAVLVWTLRDHEKSLSPAERALVGVWGHPQIDTPTDYGVPAGPMSAPWEFMELARDGTYRVWFASADAPDVRYPLVEGRWRVIDGRLRIEDIPRGARRFARDVQFRLSMTTGLLPTPQRIRGVDSVEFRLVGPDRLVVGRNQSRTFERLRPRPGRSPNLAPQRTPAAAAVSPPAQGLLGGRGR